MTLTTTHFMRSVFRLKHKKKTFNLNILKKIKCKNFNSNCKYDFAPTFYKQNHIYNLNSYKSFFKLKMLEKEKNQFKYLFEKIISKPFFLIYSYKSISSSLTNLKFFKQTNKIENIKFNWFLQYSKKLKTNEFNLKLNNLLVLPQKTKLLNRKFSKRKMLEKAIYFILLKIYKDKSDNINKNCHDILQQIKINWKKVNWFLRPGLNKKINLFENKKLINVVRRNVQDQSLLRVLEIMYKKKRFNYKNSYVTQNWLLFFLYEIYFTDFDKHIHNIIKFYVNNKIVCKKIKYTRYLNSFIVGVCGEKKEAIQVKEVITECIKKYYILKDKNVVDVTNPHKNSTNFLFHKITWSKQKSFPFLKPNILEKKLRTLNIIKKKRKQILSKRLKKETDLIWSQFKKNPLKMIFFLNNHTISYFSSIKKKTLNLLNLNRKKGIKEIAKNIIYQINQTDNTKTEKIFKHTLKIEKELKTKPFVTVLVNKNLSLLNSIRKWSNNSLSINTYKASYLLEILYKKFVGLSWPSQTLFFIILHTALTLKKTSPKKKIKNLAELVKFLKVNENYLNINLINLEKKRFIFHQTKMTNLEKSSFKFNPNFKYVYSKLKKMGILQKNLVKINSGKCHLLYKDSQIILFFLNLSKNILNYFSWCDNFLRIKSIIFYFVRLSLTATLMHKHSIPSNNKVFKKYGKNLKAKHPYKKNSYVQFLSKQQINTWPKIKIKKNIKNNYLFKNIHKIFLCFLNQSFNFSKLGRA